MSNLFFAVNCFFPSVSPPSLFLAVEDNVTEDQHSPGQTAIPSGNAPFHISSFSAGKWIMCLCVRLCVCAYVCASVCKIFCWDQNEIKSVLPVSEVFLL